MKQKKSLNNKNHLYDLQGYMGILSAESGLAEELYN